MRLHTRLDQRLAIQSLAKILFDASLLQIAYRAVLYAAHYFTTSLIAVRQTISAFTPVLAGPTRGVTRSGFTLWFLGLPLRDLLRPFDGDPAREKRAIIAERCELPRLEVVLDAVDISSARIADGDDCLDP
jgi:hypothetical protein